MIHKSASIVNKLYDSLTADFPEYTQLNKLMAMARHTWPAYGLSISELANLKEDQPYVFSLIEVSMEN